MGSRGTRPQSDFDATAVFEACLEGNTAVEINSRPERQDPPGELLTLAIETGCLFALSTDAHAPGQLDFLDYGCERAQRGVGERIEEDHVGRLEALRAAHRDEVGPAGAGADEGDAHACRRAHGAGTLAGARAKRSRGSWASAW